MAISDLIEVIPKMTQEERQARLDALFAKRDAAVTAGLETWDYNRINEEVRKQRGVADGNG